MRSGWVSGVCGGWWRLVGCVVGGGGVRWTQVECGGGRALQTPSNGVVGRSLMLSPGLPTWKDHHTHYYHTGDSLHTLTSLTNPLLLSLITYIHHVWLRGAQCKHVLVTQEARRRWCWHDWRGKTWSRSMSTSYNVDQNHVFHLLIHMLAAPTQFASPSPPHRPLLRSRALITLL